MGEGCEDTYVPYKCSSSVNSAEEEFSNEVDRMIHSGDSQPLSPAISVIATWTMSKFVCDRDGVMHGLDKMRGLFSKADQAPSAAECQIWQQESPTLPLPQGAPVSTLEAADWSCEE